VAARSLRALVRVALSSFLLTVTGGLRSLAAQNPCDFEPYGPGCYWEVSVTPAGDTVGVPVDGFTSHSLMFTVFNTGTNSDTYDLYCTSTGTISCSNSQGAVTLISGLSALISVTYGSTPGHGTLTLTAVGRSVGSTAAGYYEVFDPPLRISMRPHNGYHRSAGQCAMACFDNVTSYSTPARGHDRLLERTSAGPSYCAGRCATPGGRCVRH